MADFEVIIGRIVHLRVMGHELPAIITLVHNKERGLVNLVAFTDGTYAQAGAAAAVHSTEASRGDAVGQWHSYAECPMSD